MPGEGPARRYSTASELAADLARWLRGEPVQAQPPTLGYLLGKAVRRHRTRVALVASVLVALLLGTAAALTTLALFASTTNDKIAVKAKAEADFARKAAEVAQTARWRRAGRSKA